MKQRCQYYNSMKRPVVKYVAVVWTDCDNDLLDTML